ncbi:hypothetical protein M9458_053994, partial [Cirrhinus mrigala]
YGGPWPLLVHRAQNLVLRPCVLVTINDTTEASYDQCVTLLNEHFAAPQSVLLRRFIFRRRHQLPGESVHQFVADLRGLANSCKFWELRDEMIRDQLIEHTNNNKIRETLLLQPDDLTLYKAIAIAFQVESAAECAATLTSQTNSAHSHLTIMDTTRPVEQHLGMFPTQTYPVLIVDLVLMPPELKSAQPRARHVIIVENKIILPVQQPRTNQSSPAIIHNVTAGLVLFKSCTVMLNDVCVPLLLDTGASVSLLNANTYNQFFSELPLATPSTALCGYGDSTIALLGSLSLTAVYGKRTLLSFVFHVAHKGTNLMGLDLFSALGSSGQHCSKGLGCLTSFMHQPLIDHSITPIIQPLRRVPLALWEGVSAELQRLLSAGIIEPVDASTWVSNLVVATKKSGALCICVDLRRVNNAVIPDKYPLPMTEELTAQFYGSTVFSKLDLREGYLQVPLHADSRNLTAFVTHEGVFRYTRTPFGLSSTPSCFQMVMTTVLAGIPGVVIYLDDIVVHGPTVDIHNERLNKVFDTLAKHNLTLNAEKCLFAVPVIELVGFKLSEQGISPLQSNIEAIQSIPEPTSPAQVASFLGMTGYYLKFLLRYSNTTAPLCQLLRKDEPWVWTQECTEAVHNLKAQLTSPPILSHFSTSCKTMVTCDASATAIGAVLSQEQNGPNRAMIFSGTDHHALVALLATSGIGHRPLRLNRWYDRLRQYNYKFQFTPGRENEVADLLSRSVLVQGTTDDVNHPKTDIIQLLHTPLQSIVSLQELKTASEQDPIFSQLRTYIREGWPAQVSGELSAFARVKDELSCWNDTCPLRAHVLKMAHEGHLGIVTLKQRCRDRVWWPGINSEIELLVKDCPACLLPICGEIHGVPHNQRYLVVAYDLYSKWPELTTTGSVTLQIIVDFLDSLFARWGLPQTITTDNGPQFVSADISSYLRSKGIQQIHTTLYHPKPMVVWNVSTSHTWHKGALSIKPSTLHCYTIGPHSIAQLGELNLSLDRLRPITPQRLPWGVKTRITRQQRRMKQRFDRLRRAKEPNIAVHDWAQQTGFVLVQTPGGYSMVPDGMLAALRNEDLPYTFPSPKQGIATPQADRQNAQSLPQTPVLPAPPIISQALRILCPHGRYLKDFVATFHVLFVNPDACLIVLSDRLVLRRAVG